MLKCLVSLNNSIVRDVVRYPNNTLPMSFATKESAISYAEERVLNKPLANITNANTVFGFQPVPYNPKPNFELVG
jgi:hypothetical protein